LPLYTAADVRVALRRLRPVGYGERLAIADDVVLRLRCAGHILGSAIVELELAGRRPARVVFSGDLGRWQRPILRDPELVEEADILLVESTYGDRDHPPGADDRLAEVVQAVDAARGVLIIPSFAVGRTQELLWRLRQLEEQRRIPLLPVYLDSPMAIDVTDVYARHPEDHDLEMQALTDTLRHPLACERQQIVRRATDSKALNDLSGPMIIIAGSGMATGGRVLHHLKRRLPDAHTTVLLPGFQAAGTRGRALQEGAPEVRIHGESVPVRARIVMLEGLSAHADRADLLRWLRGFRRPPAATSVVHGEPHAADQLAATIRAKLGWDARVAAPHARLSL
jgi:metallo-beta-lactamase family protein